ncbi:MAG: peptidase M61 [Flavobacterium sp.]|nr:peptidase M61 [Flavobacterium sp.]
MKKLFLLLSITTLFVGCKTSQTATSSVNTITKNQIDVAIDLVNIVNDKVKVSIIAPNIFSDEVVFHIPKTVPGTYSTDNYGKYIDDFKAIDKSGKDLKVDHIDVNSWKISNAKSLKTISYLVNDTFEKETGAAFTTDNIFSPAGSNIDAGKNIMLNTHCFVGYFDGFMSIPYQLDIAHSANLWGATSMTDVDSSTTNDEFLVSQYSKLVENPIMYAKPNYTAFDVNGIEILIAVYSPNNQITAENIAPDMKKVLMAQSNFLKNFNTTKKYSVLIYLSDVKKLDDAKGFGALEHPTATTVVMPEILGVEQLSEQLKDVVSHEFFHIVTPLTVHAQEIQNFDYNNPKMSEHLWMYEGVTEYFANLFQINQGLIQEEEFYTRMAEKIDHASKMNDTMPFTTMSQNVLVQPYKDQYLNVYEKGALIGMCLDIIIREKSNGERGILDLMRKLSNEYGVNKAFNDPELFGKITSMTYPEVGEFLTTYVSGSTPIPYDKYFDKIGVKQSSGKKAQNVFLNGEVPFLTVNQATKEILVVPDTELNIFMKTLDLKGNDILKSINSKIYNLDNIYELIMESEKWKEDDFISILINRNGKDQTIKGKIKMNYEDINGFKATDNSKKTLKDAWLKG